MARTPVEIGQAFHKAESPLVVWTVNSFNEFTEPMHARLIRLDDELLSKVDGAVKSCWPMACLYRSLRFGEEYLPVSALLVDKT